MLKNNLKNELPLGWENMFKHREDWDPEGYSVGVFKLQGYERELVLARNDKTFDIMDYFFDDTPPNYQINLKMAIKFITGKISDKYTITKDYIIFGGGFKKEGKNIIKKVEKDKNYYPRIKLFKSTIRIHRLIAYIFIPNPNPEKYNIVNHIDCNRSNFNKENLEWCDEEWNNKAKNKKQPKISTYYIRLLDNKVFSRKEIMKEYNIENISSLLKSIKQNTKYHGSFWKSINPVLQDYLSRHPLQESWYSHPTIKNLYANGCGVFKIDDKLRVGTLHNQGCINGFYYMITINGKRYRSHRLLAECYFNRLISNDEVVDHIIPVNENDVNNSIDNLRICTQRENMNNENTIKKLGNKVQLYNIYGNFIKDYVSESICCNDINSGIKSDIISRLIIKNKYIVADKKYSIEYKLSYVFYKWSINEYGEKILISGNQHLWKLSDRVDKEFSGNIVQRLRKYLNTGMPASDGFYYQQGDPNNMIYDPTNTKLEKKRLELKWKDRNKNKNKEEGN